MNKNILFLAFAIYDNTCSATVNDMQHEIKCEKELIMLADRICWSSWCSYLEQNPQNKNNVLFSNKKLRESMYREIGKAITTCNDPVENNKFITYNNINTPQVWIATFGIVDKIDSFTQANWNAIMLYSYIKTHKIAKLNSYRLQQTQLCDIVAGTIKMCYANLSKDKNINAKIDKARSDIEAYLNASQYELFNPFYYYGYSTCYDMEQLQPTTLPFNNDTKTGSIFIPRVTMSDNIDNKKTKDLLVSVKNGKIEYITKDKTYKEMDIYSKYTPCEPESIKVTADHQQKKKVLFQNVLNDQYGLTLGSICYMASSLNCLNMSNQFRDAISQVAKKIEETGLKEIKLQDGSTYKLKLCKVINELFELTEKNFDEDKNKYMRQCATLYDQFDKASKETMKCLILTATEDCLKSIPPYQFRKEIHYQINYGERGLTRTLQQILTNACIKRYGGKKSDPKEEIWLKQKLEIETMIYNMLNNILGTNYATYSDQYRALKKWLCELDDGAYLTNAVTRSNKTSQPQERTSFYFIMDLLSEIQFELQQYGINKQLTVNAIAYAYNPDTTKQYPDTRNAYDSETNTPFYHPMNIAQKLDCVTSICTGNTSINDSGDIIIDSIIQNVKTLAENELGGQQYHYYTDENNVKRSIPIQAFTILDPIIELPDLLIINSYTNMNKDTIEMKDAHGTKKYKLVAELSTLNLSNEYHGISVQKIGDKKFIADGTLIFDELIFPQEEENYKRKEYNTRSNDAYLFYERIA